MFLNLLLITIINVIIIEFTEIINDVKLLIWKLLCKRKYEYFRLKPFDCSLCMTVWVGILYLLINKQLNLFTLTITLTFAILTPVIQRVMDLIINLMETMINRINKKIDDLND